jgi:hypothetical protein
MGIGYEEPDVVTVGDALTAIQAVDLVMEFAPIGEQPGFTEPT